MRSIYASIDKLERSEIEVKSYQRFEELYPWFVLPGMMLVVLEMILANTLLRRLP